MTVQSLNKLLRDYDYKIPPDLIAQTPATPRDSSRLLVLDASGKNPSEHVFHDLPDLLPTGSVLVLNETKVEPARLTLIKEDTGGLIRALIISKNGKVLSCLADRSVKPGQTLRTVSQDGKRKSDFRFEVISLEKGHLEMKALFAAKEITAVMDKFGAAPLPPYIKHHGLTPSSLRQRYQTVFAKNVGSAAAPTASLHFTPRLLKKLLARGIIIAKVTLHVSLGTFAPLTEKHVTENKLHEERYEIPSVTARIINAAKSSGRPVIPVGTTALRALESAIGDDGRLSSRRSATRLFIREGYDFKIADGLITNFHVPKSSLMMLVAALIGRKNLLASYNWAIARRFRFFSFGDAMFIRPKT